MAQRRYHARRGGGQYSEAAGSKPREDAPAAQHPLGSEPTPPPAPASDETKQPAAKPEAAPEARQHFSTGLKEQLDGMRRYATPDPVDQYIQHWFPMALPHERDWLRQRPHYLQRPDLVHAAGRIAMQRGVPRHSGEFLNFIDQLLHQHLQAQAAPGAAPAPPPAAPPPAAPMPAMSPMTRVDHEDHETSAHDQPEETSHIAAHHFSAPPSHADFGSAYGDDGDRNTVTLSAAERDHAKAAGISGELYAANKLKMLKAKKSGLIKD